MTDRPTLFPMGGKAFSWLREGGTMAQIDWRLSLQMRWQSFWFDRNVSLQRKIGTGAWQGDDPIFIMGLWRSGTTFMHELLSAYPGFIWPATWQCMNPSFAMQSPPRASASVARPMDDFMVNTFSPQEDEFALLAMGVPSVYRGFFDPGRLNEVSQFLDPGFWCGRSDGWTDTWREFLGGVYSGREGRLLLKSPNHTFRIRALVEEFPNASYIWLVRDPAETLFSNRKMWLAMFRRYALRNLDESDFEEFLGKAFQYAAESLQFATAVLGRGQLVVVDFARFKCAPFEAIEEVCTRLHFGEWETILESIVSSVASKAEHHGDSYADCLVGMGQIKVLESLGFIQAEALNSHGL